MSKNLNNNELNNEVESVSKESPSFNKPRDLSTALNTTKPWYKKKGTIIAMSSTLGSSVLVVAVAVPVILTQSNLEKPAELASVKAAYDLTNKTAKLIVNGANLPEVVGSYIISKVTTTRALVDITKSVKLYPVNSSEVYFDFNDENITASSVYQVQLNNTSSANKEVVSDPKQNILQPTFTITSNPTDQTVLESAVDKSATFSVAISQITNPVANATVTYQWEISDTQTGTFTPINDVEAKKATYKYNAKDLAVDTKKFLRCKVSYQYMIPVISTPASVTKVTKSVIEISTHPTNQNLNFSDTTATLSVVANIVQGANGQDLTYQWLSAPTIDGAYSEISGATLTDYTLTSAELSAITPGVKKYFKCKVSAANAISVDSNPAYIDRTLAPVITISAFSPSVEMPYTPTSPTLSVTASVVNGTQDQITYQWESSDDNTSWSTLGGANSSTYNFTDASTIQPGGKKYFRCQVGYTNADITPQYSTVIYISRALQPAITISTQPANVELTHSQNDATLRVVATVANGVGSQGLTYQWQESTTESGSYANVTSNGTSDSYALATVGYGFSKYYKCIISSANADSKTTNPARISKLLQPVITIGTQPTPTVALTAEESTATLSVVATVEHGVTNQPLTYQWKTSTTQDGQYTNVASGGTNASLTLTDVAFDSSNFYKCEISSAYAEMKTSNVSHVTRATQPIPVISLGSTSLANQTLPFAATAATAFTVNATVTNGQTSQITYKWQSSASETTGFADIASATAATYTPDLSTLEFGVKKYFKCIVSHTGAANVETNVAFVLKTPQSTIEITTAPTAQILRSTDTQFSLNVVATITNLVGSGTITYQWQSSPTQNGTYENITDATSATYTKQLDANTKNSLRDAWYKCQMIYSGAVTPTVYTTPVLVKMTLTAAEARLEFIKWSAIRTNYEPIIKEFFKGINTERSSLHLYYTSLQDHTFKVGSEPKNVEVVSVEGLTLPVTGAVDGLKTYKIRLKTLGESTYSAKTGSDTAEKILPANSFIEFYTLFSFQGNNKILRNTEGSADYDMNLSLSFTETASAFTTTAQWTSTNVNNAPSVNNPLKKNAYPVKFYSTDGTTEIFADSLLFPVRPSATAFTTANTNPAFPAYHIRLNR